MELKAKLGFYFETPDWLPRDIFQLLINFGDWKRIKGKTVFFMPLSNFAEIQRLVPRLINIPEDEIVELIELFPLTGVKIKLDEFKGKSGYDVIEYPDYFELISWQKTKDNPEPKQRISKVPKEIVGLLWGVLKEYPAGQPISCKIISKRVCEKLGVTRFHRNTRSFDWQKFFGARKHSEHGYFTLYYNPLKVLEHYGVVKHSSSGMIARISDMFEIQLRFRRANEI